VQGRGAQGVRCLKSSKSGGKVGGIAAGQGGTLDVYLADGRRQRLEWKEIPSGARDALGKRVVEAGKAAVARVVALP